MAWITTAEAAQIIGITTIRVRQLVANGTLKAERFGRDWKVSEASARGYQRQKPGPKPKKPRKPASETPS